MAELRIEGRDAVLLSAVFDQKRSLEREIAQLEDAAAEHIRGLDERVPEVFGVRVERGAIIAYWDEPEGAEDV